MANFDHWLANGELVDHSRSPFGRRESQSGRVGVMCGDRLPMLMLKLSVCSTLSVRSPPKLETRQLCFKIVLGRSHFADWKNNASGSTECRWVEVKWGWKSESLPAHVEVKLSTEKQISPLMMNHALCLCVCVCLSISLSLYLIMTPTCFIGRIFFNLAMTTVVQLTFEGIW